MSSPKTTYLWAPGNYEPAGTSSQTLGVTVIELLVIVAIVGIMLSIGVFSGRQALVQRQEIAAVNTLRQSIWQGATAASSRGQTVVLHRNGRILELRSDSGIVRRDELPSGVSTNLPQGVVLEFSPPGKVVEDSLLDLLEIQPRVSAGGKTFVLEISVIGEVRATEVR